MARRAPSIRADKPTPVLERSLEIDGTRFFTAVLKAAINIVTARPADALAELPEIGASLGIGTSDEDRVWHLVIRAFQRASCDLLSEYFNSNSDPVAAIAALDWDSATDRPIAIELDASFLRDPANSETAKRLSARMNEWLLSAGIRAIDASNISSRLQRYFALALHNEWRSNSALYSPIRDVLDSPFLPAATKDLDWSRYRSTMIAAIDEPVFEESFSLRQIYIPARSYYLSRDPRDPKHAPTDDSAPGRHVDWLMDEIVRWVSTEDSRSPIRLISGGPGSGKSSFAKSLAAILAHDSHYNPLFIPLHLIDTDVGLSRGISEFLLSAGYFSESPLESPPPDPMVLILDGLDELQMQGQALQSVAQQVTADLARLLDRMNSTVHRIVAVVTGRELAVQSAEANFKGEREVLHVLPYHVKAGTHENWRDPKGILARDQREEWWQSYGRLTGEDYKTIPPELKAGELDDVTSQPLLNYLVSLSYRRGGLTLDANTNINMVYADLLSAVYERGWARNPHPAVQGIREDDFLRLLEEVALSVWHGAGRTTTLREVEEHCRESRISGLLPSLEGGASGGVSNLLLAFYFRQKGRRESGDKTFEFTHKSFAEYLIALRIVRAIDQVCKKIQNHELDPDEGWDDDEALFRWVGIFGPTRLDADVLVFVRRELAARRFSKVSEYQFVMSKLFHSSLARGWPMHRFNTLRFHEQCRYWRNAEESLFCCINACALATKALTQIDWPTSTSFGDTLARCQGQRSGPSNGPFMDSLSYLNLNTCCLDLADLFGANLRNSSMRDCELHYTNLCRANLEDADLRGSTFMLTMLEDAVLDRTKFSRNVTHEHGSIFIDPRMERETAGPRRVRSASTEDLRKRGAELPPDESE